MGTKLKKSLGLKRDQKEAVSTKKAPPIFTEFSPPTEEVELSPDEDKHQPFIIHSKDQVAEYWPWYCYVCNKVVKAGNHLCPDHYLPLISCYCGEKLPEGKMLCDKHKPEEYFFDQPGKCERRPLDSAFVRHWRLVKELIGQWEASLSLMKAYREVLTEQIERMEEGKVPTIPQRAMTTNSNLIGDSLQRLRSLLSQQFRLCKCGCGQRMGKYDPSNKLYITGHSGKARQAKFKKFSKKSPRRK